jgi:hypothetical protein
MFLILIIYKDFNLFFQTFRKFAFTKVHPIAQVRPGFENGAAFLSTRSPGSEFALRKISGELKLSGTTALSISHLPSFPPLLYIQDAGLCAIRCSLPADS